MSDYMLTIETKELEISLELKRKVEMICKFACAKPTFTNGNIKSIKETINRDTYSSLYLILFFYIS